MTESVGGIIIIVLLGILALFIYFLPTIIASGKNSTATFLIFLLNLFGGWTVALWILFLFGPFVQKGNDVLNLNYKENDIYHFPGLALFFSYQYF